MTNLLRRRLSPKEPFYESSLQGGVSKAQKRFDLGGFVRKMKQLNKQGRQEEMILLAWSLKKELDVTGYDYQ